MVAFALLMLHMPPVVASVNVMAVPVQTMAGPDMVPAVGAVPIVMSFVALAVPQILVTV